MNQLSFELCVETLAAGRAAKAGGADRIELCSALDCGGITPSAGLIDASLQSLDLPVYVLIRPRGGSFFFSAEELDLMSKQIEQAKLAGASGITVGVLLEDGRVDVERTRALIELARPLAVTFHRAFDETPHLFEALEDVIRTGADSLLTSGGARDVLTGAGVIGTLRESAGDRIHLIAGGGLRLESLIEVVRRSGVFSLHGSLSRKNGKYSANANGQQLEADVREAIRLLKSEYCSPTSPILKK